MADRLLKIGCSGEDVRVLEAFLNLHEPTLPLLDMGTKFDARTLTKVINFQRRKKLVVDGVVGPKTRAALGMDLAPTVLNTINFRAVRECITTLLTYDYRTKLVGLRTLSGLEYERNIFMLIAQAHDVQQEMEGIIKGYANWR